MCLILSSQSICHISLHDAACVSCPLVSSVQSIEFNGKLKALVTVVTLSDRQHTKGHLDHEQRFVIGGHLCALHKTTSRLPCLCLQHFMSTVSMPKAKMGVRCAIGDIIQGSNFVLVLAGMRCGA